MKYLQTLLLNMRRHCQRLPVRAESKLRDRGRKIHHGLPGCRMDDAVSVRVMSMEPPDVVRVDNSVLRATGKKASVAGDSQRRDLERAFVFDLPYTPSRPHVPLIHDRAISSSVEVAAVWAVGAAVHVAVHLEIANLLLRLPRQDLNASTCRQDGDELVVRRHAELSKNAIMVPQDSLNLLDLRCRQVIHIEVLPTTRDKHFVSVSRELCAGDGQVLKVHTLYLGVLLPVDLVEAKPLVQAGSHHQLAVGMKPNSLDDTVRHIGDVGVFHPLDVKHRRREESILTAR
mmetsp:Transcript_39681/g.124700  ORF Transcript_39681/g.124700 Transcript_39681/m.124700 type:complete len:287 (+) Transcript_39681:458-1318(+)